MTAAANLPIDPDLDLALREMRHVHDRLTMLETRLTVDGADKNYLLYGHLISQRDDAAGAIASRAERLGIKPGSLRLFIAEYDRLRRTSGRKPTLAQLQRAVIAANERMREYLLERRADQAVATFNADHASRAANDAEGATAYLEACCAR